jgi:hypothetical protein
METRRIICVYAWNASPIYGTDISRSLVAIGRESPFPIDIEGAVHNDADRQGQSSLEHHEAATPFFVPPTLHPQHPKL